MPRSQSSPQPKQAASKKPVSLSFFDGLKQVCAGKKITKMEWKSGHYLVLMDERLKIYNPDQKIFQDLIVSYADMIGTDWIVVE